MHQVQFPHDFRAFHPVSIPPPAHERALLHGWARELVVYVFGFYRLGTKGVAIDADKYG
jgi:hypothetical protein